jgi:glucosylceramidase
MKMFPLILSFAAALFAGCGEKPNVDPEPPVPPVPDSPVATVYTTSVAGKRFDESTITLKKPDDVHFYKVERSGETFQEVDGFGLAITQASCYNLLLMPAEERTAFLTELFSREEGLG